MLNRGLTGLEQESDQVSPGRSPRTIRLRTIRQAIPAGQVRPCGQPADRRPDSPRSCSPRPCCHWPKPGSRPPRVQPFIRVRQRLQGLRGARRIVRVEEQLTFPFRRCSHSGVAIRTLGDHGSRAAPAYSPGCAHWMWSDPPASTRTPNELRGGLLGVNERSPPSTRDCSSYGISDRMRGPKLHDTVAADGRGGRLNMTDHDRPRLGDRTRATHRESRQALNGRRQLSENDPAMAPGLVRHALSASLELAVTALREPRNR